MLRSLYAGRAVTRIAGGPHLFIRCASVLGEISQK